VGDRPDHLTRAGWRDTEWKHERCSTQVRKRLFVLQRCEHSFKLNLTEVAYEIQLAQDLVERRDFFSAMLNLRFLGEISGSYGSEYEVGSPVGCCAVYPSRKLPTFQRCLLSPSSRPSLR
jgi:hypothetical protein